MTHAAQRHANAVRALTGWTPPPGDADQERLRRDFLAFLSAHPADGSSPDACSRACRAGHLTASALVIEDGTGRVLLTRHATVGRWLQLGGHVEPGDADLAAAALREAREESGITDLTLSSTPLRLDRHRVRCRYEGEHTDLDHLDVQYAALAPRGSVATPEGAAPLDWFAPDALPGDADHAVRALVAAALPRWSR